MAVVKVKYTRSRPRMKAHIRYITHRPGRDREKISRALFDNHGLSDKQRAYHMVDMAPRGTNFFKIVISPDPKREDRYKDLDLPHITRQTILQLAAQIGRHVQFIGTIHNDHTPNRHVHTVCCVQGRLTQEDFLALRKTATYEALFQRKMRNRVRENPRLHYLYQSVRTERRARSVRPVRLQGGCVKCGYGTLTGISYYVSRCPMCHAPLKRYPRASLRLEVQR
jgi:hypothetical protein